MGREGRTETPSYLEPTPTPRGTPAWQLVVPDRRTYEKIVGDGTVVTLVRLGLLEETDDESRVILTDYGIKTWNRFCERGGQWPDDLVEKGSSEVGEPPMAGSAGSSLGARFVWTTDARW